MKMLKLAIAAVTIALCGSAIAQSYPAKPIVFYGLAPGGAPEGVQRAIFDKVKENTGASLLWEAKPGGGGAVGLLAVKGAAPDGYTMAITYASAINLNPLINKDLGIDPIKDFVPVTNLFSLGVVLAARDDFPAKDIRGLVAMAKEKPESVRVGIFGAGNKSWIAMLEERAGVKFLQVPFKTTSELIAQTLGGHLDTHFETVGVIVAQNGKLKALSYGGVSPSKQLPNVPLVRDLYKFDMLSWFGVVAPVGTPPAAVNWVNREIARAIKDPKIAQMIESNGFTAVGNTVDEFAQSLRAEVEQNRELVRKYPDIK
jgi:tripartite-type tricarboxylate transporter receptor subunit TctC